ncbi:leucine-rich repeat protein [Butyrivibrio sp. INlla16]|uniref:leucine-rich repeat protein n=1 Tax=Butyrivibrio sp. INlla16 TaxID=1520807 RepID=UPI00088F8395|nr:leucine-rich repeat protein [Butyrivibrio sp. INlla16]SDB50628.1 Transglutaminase-like superfamily protein [Butyrivibrio sp. INlla16]
MRKHILSFAIVFMIAFCMNIVTVHAEKTGFYGYYYSDGYTCCDFKGTGIEKVVEIPSDVTQLHIFMFFWERSLEKIIVPSNVKVVKARCFYGCENLKYIVFKGDVEIEENAIVLCKNLKAISAPMNSGAYRYAKEHGIRVVTSPEPCFEKGKVYCLKGDKVYQDVVNNIDDITWSSSNSKVAEVGNDGIVKVKKAGKAKIAATVAGTTASYTIVAYARTEENRIKQAKKEEISNGKTAIQKLKNTHDWMIRNISYDHKARNKIRNNECCPSESNTTRSALLKNKAMCLGYARTYKKILDNLKVPCIIVSGRVGYEGHAWNMVKLNGKWYNVDVTWDDPDRNNDQGQLWIEYKYFLKSTAYMSQYRNQYFAYKNYPRCTSTKYDSVTKF